MRVTSASGIDAITLELVQATLNNIVREMRATLMRSSYAPILYETHDFSCSILDHTGEIVGMYVDVPHHNFQLVFCTQYLLDKYGEDIHPGDVFYINDPYIGGTHLNDIALLLPVFYEDKLVHFTTAGAHWGDVGGLTPGSVSGTSTELFHEGLRIPMVKICDQGKLNEPLLDTFLANVCMPFEARGDFMAQLQTARLGEKRIIELYERYGPETIGACLSTYLHQAEVRMRNAITALPDGVYFAEDYLENSGTSPDPVVVRCKTEIHGDTMNVDFTGTSPQVAGPTNTPYTCSLCGVFNVLKTFLDPGVLMNSGGWRPINVEIPEGTTLNPTWPAPVGGFADIMFGPVQGCMLSVLGQLIPDQLSATLRSGANQVNASGTDPTKGKALWHLFEFASGGWPACKDNGGNLNTYQWDMGDLPTIWPFERMEQIRPLKAQYNDMYVDSGGPGYRRGGLGLKRMWEVTAPTGAISVLTSDAILPRPGMSMGYGGALNSITAQRDGKELTMSDIPGKVGGFPLQQGDQIITLSSGGGGYGDPLTRPVEWVKDDIESGYVSIAGAHADHGVVITDNEIDTQATEEVRQQLREQRMYVSITASDKDNYDKKGRRLLLVSQETAEGLQVEDGSIAEYVPESGVPLRAWIKIDLKLKGIISALGPVGRAILHLSEDETMWVRTPWTFVKG